MSGEIEELDYHGHLVRSIYNGAEPGFSSHSCFVYLGDDHQFTVVVKMGVIISMTKYKGRDEERKTVLRETALNHSKARIDLGKYKQDLIYEVLIDEPKSETDPSELSDLLIEAYRNIRQICPRDYRRQSLSLPGVEGLLNVSGDDIARALNDLYDKGIIETSDDPTESLGTGHAWISQVGLDPSSPTATPTPEGFQYDVVLSFAGEDREIAKQIAVTLDGRGVSVFYDEFEQATLWGKNLYDYLSDLYENRGAFCLMICSESYARKLWTNRERQSAQARAFREHREYILPLRLDDTKIPGIDDTTGFLGLSEIGMDGVIDAIVLKVEAYRSTESNP